MPIGKPGNLLPRLSAITKFTKPAAKPLIQAICNASLADILRVRLLSIAQQAQAPAIAKAPHGKAAFSCFGHDNSRLPRTMQTIPIKIRLSKCSLNMNQANVAVSTLSRLSNSEAMEAGVDSSPCMSNAGPSMPPEMIAPASQGKSDNWMAFCS